MSDVFADQIMLKNGDRLTGKIVKKDGDKIIIETESAGTVTVLWSAVDKIVSDEPLNLKLSDGQLIKGTVATEEENIEVATQDAGTVEDRRRKILKSFAPKREQAKFEAEEERLRDPGCSIFGAERLMSGLVLRPEIRETRALTAGFRGNRKRGKDKISVYANAIQASNSNSGDSVTTAQAVYGGIRYDYNLSEKIFVFASGDFEYDKPQQLDLRSVIGAGFGYKAIRSDRTRLIFLAVRPTTARIFDRSNAKQCRGSYRRRINFCFNR